MKAAVVVFPFDLFGSAGTGAGAQLLGDAVREVLDDADEETKPTRADAYRGKVEVREAAFDTPDQIRDWRSTGKKLADEALDAGEFVVWLAGNHLAALPVFEQLGPDTLVVQFDAHLDINDFHDTTEELCHGNFLRLAGVSLPKIVNVGHRDLLLPAKSIRGTFAAAFSAEEVAADPTRVAKELLKLAGRAKRIWIDLDCDAIDPAHLPAVQCPLPFGLLPQTLLMLLNAIWNEKVVGISISEFDPGRDMKDASLNLIGWFLEWLLLKKAEG